MGIRDILIFAIIAAGIPFMLRSPAIAIMFWVWIGMMNPHKLAFGFAQNFPFAVLVAGLTFASLVISREKLRFKSRPAVLVLFVFCVWTTITTFFALNPEDAWPEWERAMKIQLLTFVALLALNTRRHVEMLVAVLTLSVAFFGVKGGLYTLRTGGEGMVYGPGGFLSENNSTALAILMSMPLIWYFYLQAERRWLKWALVIALPLCGVAVLGSQSRGAFLGIAAIALMLVLKSSHRLGLLLGLLVIAPAALTFMPEKWVERMHTIGAYEQDGSAMGRINAWTMAFRLANDRPIGGGFETGTAEVFARYAPNPGSAEGGLAAHSIYFQVLGEQGWLGLALFLLIWIFTWLDASWIVRRSNGSPHLKWASQLAAMVQVSLVGYLVSGAFLNLAYWDMPYYLMVAIVVTRYLVADALKESQSSHAGEPGQLAPRHVTDSPQLR